ncbi:putative Mg2+ transporter-C (MgtC) family protein [Caldalkalibacillus uzonensis]|uniref:Mg2+ transporter-C (MgtC) family protein n=1 Tax=Caldalkalibacillus uzonensis TaxID=353224 RepID=A0ABU0CUR0_9BACI|nr:MgtC/SapB family protein [Caldalkalibacillus uzonensis]MDQ0340151.1 putative Mg2+ transporter-C (MgtC) family protein [Caldalkalibacillus uzonensis]
MELLHEWWMWIQDAHYLEITLRLLLATLLGGLVGLEREQSNRPAGFRTHILVCVGSALIMLISIYGFEEYIKERSQYGYVVADPARLAAQVVSGIGFLGAGTILVHGFAIRGLTTAASLWVVAGIGLALGAGFYFGAILSTGLVLLSLIVLNRFESVVLHKSYFHRLVIKVEDQPGKLGEIATTLGEQNVNIRKLSIEEAGQTDPGTVRLVLNIRIPNTVSMAILVDQLRNLDGVKEVSIDK